MVGTFWEEGKTKEEHMAIHDRLKKVLGRDNVLDPFGLSSRSFHHQLGTRQQWYLERKKLPEDLLKDLSPLS